MLERGEDLRGAVWDKSEVEIINRYLLLFIIIIFYFISIIIINWVESVGNVGERGGFEGGCLG